MGSPLSIELTQKSPITVSGVIIHPRYRIPSDGRQAGTAAPVASRCLAFSGTWWLVGADWDASRGCHRAEGINVLRQAAVKPRTAAVCFARSPTPSAPGPTRTRSFAQPLLAWWEDASPLEKLRSKLVQSRKSPMIDRRTFLATGVVAAAASFGASAARIAQTPRANGPAPWVRCPARASCAGIGGSNTPSCILR